jgi:glutamate-1-semialdehyde 2,1-aminomutase|tara:strand:- start:67 stop:2094 length:2028 start_codon:yes stop_codon:yes gene_type:complete
MKFVAIVQARMGSIRLPNKVMKPIIGIPMIEILLKRLNKSKLIDQIVLATSTDKKNRPLVDQVERIGFTCMQGSELDVLDRYIKAAKQFNADAIVRITGDCPLVDPVLVDECINGFIDSKVDYYSNAISPTFPDGLDIEVIKFSALKKAAQDSIKLPHREHVTSYIKEYDIFSKLNHCNNEDLSALRWTVDDPEDFDVISKVFEHFKPNIYFSWKKVIELYNNQPQLFAANSQTKRNEGEVIKIGQKLWKGAKKVIPGGNMLLSKRPEMFLPNQWPTYFSKAKGCKVWDLDGNEYIDMSIMGIGTNILGYGHPEVDEAVSKTIQFGNMSTLNCPEEVYLAEKLIELHKWSDMVKFARSGGEANAIAIRIARAFSGRDKVAICGYHGWHDWYLSANLNNDNGLDGHLFPGLEPNGVPRNLQGTVFPFNYNRFDELEALVKKHEIGVIKMEVERNNSPDDGFLQNVRKLATQNEIVLIFDECTSGFRETFGGLHKKYNVEPDMAMFGKAMGNGYAITAVIGRREIMEAAQSTFISSTFWTERIGPTAALKTLEIMEREKSWESITSIGIDIRERWQKLADRYELKIIHQGLPALASFSIESKNALAYKTLITQEMLSKGYLAANSIYVCAEHTTEVLEGYFEVLDRVFGLIAECEKGRDVKKLLKGDICHSGFKRLN